MTLTDTGSACSAGGPVVAKSLPLCSDTTSGTTGHRGPGLSLDQQFSCLFDFGW